LWWAIPFAIITVLAIVTYKSSHELDPFKSISSNQQPLSVQVVALRWKWLFIYPAQKIATVNYLEIPQGRPINFEITSDAPMNSFWIPQLAGQIYAMPGMSTELHLVADQIGYYRGSSANISGNGFADMNFTVNSATQNDFNHWVSQVKNGGGELNRQSYSALAAPGISKSARYFASANPDIYSQAIVKYILPPNFQAAPTAGKGVY
jgi:cytochrome o ubiquinol oxidase subunit 2